jgi:hypothetical protein
LAATLCVSQPLVSRLTRQLGKEVLVFGRTPPTRYALARSIRRLPDDLRVFRVRMDGTVDERRPYSDGRP